MTDTTTQRRRPIVSPAPGPVPGPSSSNSGGGSISQRAIAVREQAAQATGQASTQMLKREEPRYPVQQKQEITYAPPVMFPETGIGEIAGAVASVMAQIGTIPKTGRNKFHGYDYATVGDIFHVLTPLLGRNGLMIIQNEIEVKNVENNRLAVTYQFTVAHKSGQIWPERPTFTSVVMARDSKGNVDEKAVNKAHTNARKYFALALFNVPAGDYDDPDESDANQRNAAAPVPGPAPQGSIQAAGDKAVEILKDVTKVEWAAPQKIGLGAGAGVDQWANRYINQIKLAKSEDEIKQWDALNDVALQNISDNHGAIYDMIADAVDARLIELGVPVQQEKGEPVEVMPDPKVDPIPALNWVAEHLAHCTHYDEAERFWNQYVAPRESDFVADAWEQLMGEWKRTEQRLAPDGEIIAPQQQ